MRTMLKQSAFISLTVVTLLVAPALARATVEVDRSFGSNGVVEGKFEATYSRTAFTSLLPQADGALLATRRNGSEATATIRRYTATGALDTSFSPVAASNRAEAVEAEGKTLKAFEDFLERLNPDGPPDPTFGVHPYGTKEVSDHTGFKIETIEPLPSGKILVGGSVVVHEPETVERAGRTYVEQLALARFDHEGALG